MKEMVAGRNVQVRINKIEVVVPEIPIHKHWLPLSNLDLLLPPIHPTSFFCYKKPLDEKYTYDYMVKILKNSLAKVLVPYYPLTGEIVQNTFGEPEIFCNSNGVDFILAYADVELPEIDFYKPDESIRGKFVPPVRRGVCAFQATELKCGGIVVGFAVDHRVTDGYSKQMLCQSWIEAAQGKPFSQIPSFRRSLLFPLHPGRLDSLVNHFYMPALQLPPPQEKKLECDSISDEVISRIYYIKADVITQLQSLANRENESAKKRSKFEAFSAFLWKTLASSVSDSSNRICRLGIVVDGRSRLGAGDKSKFISMMAYYGNVLAVPFCEKKRNVLCKKPLNWVANEVHDFLVDSATKDHFLGLIDFVQANRPGQTMPKIYSTRVQEEGPGVVVSAGHYDPAAAMDFGWGCSKFSCNYFPWGGQSGYVGTMPSVTAHGDWIVYMNLLKEQLDFLEIHAPQVFKPLTSDYLNLF